MKLTTLWIITIACGVALAVFAVLAHGHSGGVWNALTAIFIVLQIALVIALFVAHRAARKIQFACEEFDKDAEHHKNLSDIITDKRVDTENNLAKRCAHCGSNLGNTDSCIQCGH